MLTRTEKGFTLIELMIVVAIIGILAAIAIPNFLNLKDKAIWGTTKANTDVIRSALASYAADAADNRYPAGAGGTNYAAISASLPNANLPANNLEAKILALTYGVNADRDSYTLTVQSTNKYGDFLTGSPTGISPAVYPH